jgi:hypothetical protein
MKNYAVLLGLLLLPGCATIFEGTSQSVAISTDPPGADCTIDRAGSRVGQVNPTPGLIHIDKSKNDLTVSCKHAGYQTATVAQSSKFQLTTFGNILIGGVVGVVVDAASGANFEYPTDVRMSMAPDPAAVPVAALPVAAMPLPIIPVAYQK